MQEKSYTTFEAADLCQVNPSTVIKWANQRRFRVYTTPGGHRRIPESVLREFFRQQGLPMPPKLNEGTPRILILEDDQDVGPLLVRSFRRSCREADVVWRQDGVQGLLELGRRPFQLVLLDLDIPLVDGSRVLATLKADPLTQNIRVVVMTGLDGSEERFLFARRQADAFFQKPFRVPDLVAAALSLAGVQRPRNGGVPA